jgi:hypothetical protein
MKEKIGRQYMRQSSASADRVCLSPNSESALERMTLQRVVTNTRRDGVFSFGVDFKSGPAPAKQLGGIQYKTQRSPLLVASERVAEPARFARSSGVGFDRLLRFCGLSELCIQIPNQSRGRSRPCQ